MNKPGKKVNLLMEQGQETTAGLEHAGAYLRKLRTEKGLSVKDAVEATRISEVNLRAMEEQDFAALPADTFTRGLLNIYAQYLGADPANIVGRFMRERDKNQGDGKRGRTRPASRQILAPKKLAEPAQVSSIAMAGILLLFIVVLFTAFCLYTSWNPFSFLSREADSTQSATMHALPDNYGTPPGQAETDSDDSAPSSSTAVQPQPGSVTTGEASPGQIPAPATATPPGTSPTGANSVSVEFLKDTRLIFTRDNEQPVSALYKKGEMLSWPGAASMQLTFDQADSAKILVNEQPVAFPDGENGLFTLRLPVDHAQPSAP